MSLRSRVLALLLPVAGIALAGCTSDPVHPDFDLAIVGATVIDGTGTAPMEDVTILIDDGRAAVEEARIKRLPVFAHATSADVWGEPEQNLTDPFLRSGVEPSVLISLLESGLVSDGAPGPADWEWRAGLLDDLRTAHEAGVAIVAGSDTGNMFVFPGFSLHFELELLVEAGLSPMEALVAATQRAAELIGKEEEFGTLEPGKRADLLVLGSDPLRDIRNTRTLELVIRSGEVIDRAGLLP